MKNAVNNFKYLLERYKKDKKFKWIVNIVAILFLIGAIGSIPEYIKIYGGSNSNSDNNSSANQATKTASPSSIPTVTLTQTSATTTPVASQTPTIIVPTLTQEEQDKKNITDTFNRTNIQGKNKEITINFNSGNFDITIYFTAFSFGEKKQTESQIKFDMEDFYYNILKSYKNKVNTITIASKMDLVDSYGNDVTNVIYQTQLNKEKINKINWEQEKETLLYTILPSQWDLQKNKLDTIY